MSDENREDRQFWERVERRQRQREEAKKAKAEAEESRALAKRQQEELAKRQAIDAEERRARQAHYEQVRRQLGAPESATGGGAGCIGSFILAASLLALLFAIVFPPLLLLALPGFLLAAILSSAGATNRIGRQQLQMMARIEAKRTWDEQNQKKNRDGK